MRKLLLSTVAATAVLSSAALAADLPARAPAIAPAPVFVAMNWSGFYIGAQVGYGWGDASTRAFGLLGPGTVGVANPNADGFFGGLHAGYNVQMGSIVVGVEADINAGDLSSGPTIVTVAGVATANRHSAKLEWFGSARARLGVAFGNVLPYITGGVAFGDVKYRFAYVAATGTLSDTAVGWTVGAGLEYAISQNLSLRGEYRYTDYGSTSGRVFPAFPAERQTGSLKTHDVRIGLSYRFGGPAAAVVAKY